MLLVFLFIILAAAFVALIFTLYTLYSLLRDKVPYVATPDWAIDWLTSNLNLKDGDVVYDLGCGDARVIRALKRKFPGIKAIGYERNWWPYIVAKSKNRDHKVEIRRTDFYQADVRDASMVFCFLIEQVMPKVETLLRSQLKSGTMVYSFGFWFPSWRPIDQIVNPKKPHGSKINIYQI